MNKLKNILVPKESKANETRVGLTPTDAKILISKNLNVYIESNAGKLAGFTNEDYLSVGAVIRDEIDDLCSKPENLNGLFRDIDFILRAKRPSEFREDIELNYIKPNTVIVAAFDPYENNGKHLKQYKEKAIIIYSIDQAKISNDDPMNVLASMSKMAGKLAFESALKLLNKDLKTTLIIGGGNAGISAAREAQKVSKTIIIKRSHKASYENIFENIIIMPEEISLDIIKQQAFIKKYSLAADIIITTARAPQQKAPLLFSVATLNELHSGTVIVDLALSEGGNVEGSQHDKTIVRDNGVIITNESGYPKKYPHEASILWSRANLEFIMNYIENPDNHKINSCML